MKKSFKVNARRDWPRGGDIEIFLYKDDESGTDVLMPGNVQRITHETRGIEQVLPSFHLDYETAQRMMDALWDAGLRPAEGSGSAGQLADTQRHLEDMRHLIFKTKPKTP